MFQSFLKRIFNSKSKSSQIQTPQQPTQTVSADVSIHQQYLNHLRSHCKSDKEAQFYWEHYYNHLDDYQRDLIWNHANWRLPNVKINSTKKLINLLWSRVFYNDDHLTKIAGRCPIRTQEDEGLIYCYLINGQVRYVGQTRENSLKRRMTRRQSNGKIGYNYSIKRHLINAYRNGSLSIWTMRTAISKLDNLEKQLIERYAPYHRLWNQEHNKYFKMSNYDF